MKLLILLLSVAVSTAAGAQATWAGLHFGQSRDDVRAQLAARGMTMETSQEGTLQSTSDYQLALPNLRNPLPMFVSFHFSDSGLLADVTLTVDLQGMRRYWNDIGNDDALTGYAADKLAGSLSGRYGVPIYSSPACENEPKPAVFCTVSWHGNQQTIEMERLPSARGTRLLVRYQLLAADL